MNEFRGAPDDSPECRAPGAATDKLRSERPIIDISPPLSEATAVWPGDSPLSRQWLCRLDQGSNIDLSTLTTTVHIGAHADAPSHFGQGAPTIDQVALEPYLGPCLVATVQKERGGVIDAEDCRALLLHGARRILFRTLSQEDLERFDTDFVSFTPEAIRLLGEAGVVLIGIDTASVDAFDSKSLDVHHELLRFGMRNLEGLRLTHVSDGLYELIALPLRLKGFDASPVRAILRPL